MGEDSIILSKLTCLVLVLASGDKLRIVYLDWIRPQNSTATIPENRKWNEANQDYLNVSISCHRVVGMCTLCSSRTGSACSSFIVGIVSVERVFVRPFSLTQYFQSNTTSCLWVQYEPRTACKNFVLRSPTLQLNPLVYLNEIRTAQPRIHLLYWFQWIPAEQVVHIKYALQPT